MAEATSSTGRWIVGVTGASGICYARKLIEVLSESVSEVHLIFSDAGLRVLKDEEGISSSHSKLTSELLIGREAQNIFFYNPRDIGAEPASGSAQFDGMVVVPCTMGTLASIANGICGNLIHRAADVTLKERRKLIVAPRETPLSTIHLRNMVSLSEVGATIAPAMPGFYAGAEDIQGLVDHFVMKLMDLIGIQTDLAPRWKPLKESGEAIPFPAPVVRKLAGEVVEEK